MGALYLAGLFAIAIGIIGIIEYISRKVRRWSYDKKTDNQRLFGN